KVPPSGAAPARVTVPVAVSPPVTLVGVIDTETRVEGTRVSVAETVLLPRIAWIVAVSGVVTGTVVIWKVAERWLAGTVTKSGTVTFGSSPATWTVVRAGEGAGAPSVIVPTAVAPPVTVGGLMGRPISGVVLVTAVKSCPPVSAARLIRRELGVKTRPVCTG